MRLDRFMVLLTLTAALLNSVQLPVLSQIQQHDSGEVVPAEIVLRLLNSDFLEAQQIFLYELPNNLPIQLPLPNHATVLASVVYRVEGFDFDFYRVLLDVPQPPETVASQYRQQLEASGWEEPTQHYAAQWESAGWSPYGEETNGSVKKVWMLEDEAGQPWQGTLTIEPSAEQSGMYRAIATVEALQENFHE
jgi:hypothetical protein